MIADTIFQETPWPRFWVATAENKRWALLRARQELAATIQAGVSLASPIIKMEEIDGAQALLLQLAGSPLISLIPED